MPLDNQPAKALRSLVIVAGFASLAFVSACQTTKKDTPGDWKEGSTTTGSEAAPVTSTAPTMIAPPPSTSGGQTGAVSSAPLPGSSTGATSAGTTAPVAAVAATLVEAGERIFFETDRHDLTDAAREILSRQAAWINANAGKRVIVAGNCDERGTREYNLALGARRANAARDYLVSLGVSGGRIETVSYGKERPIDERPNPEGWAVNRNAHTILLD
jgi:peptidoglycan-associated lipoprotein